MPYYVYMVRCEGGTHYTGIAAHICRRMREHVEKRPQCARYTRAHTVTALDGLWRAEDRPSAARLEYAVKQLSRQEKLHLLKKPEDLKTILPRLEGEDYEYMRGVTLEMCLRGEFNHGD